MGIFYAGLDLGQQGDYTALAILERVEVQVGEPQIKRVEYQPDLPSWWASSEYALVHGAHAVPPDWPVIVEEKVIPPETRVEFHLRHLERPELGTPYPAIVERVCALLSRPPLSGPQAETTLIVDATGVGRPVVDLLRARDDLPGALVPITITGADSVTRDDHGREWRVPKRDLVGVLQVLLQTGRLKVAEGLPLGATLAAEMLNFKAKISASGHDTYEAGPASEWREGAHDDLVLAVTLPCWYAEQANNYGPRITFLDW